MSQLKIIKSKIHDLSNDTAIFIFENERIEADSKLWRGSVTPKIGDLVELVIDQSNAVTRFFPVEDGYFNEKNSTESEKNREVTSLDLNWPRHRAKNISIFGKPYKIEFTHGFVLAADSNTESSISTSYRYSGTGWVPDIESYSFTTSEIRLLHQDKTQSEFSLGQKYNVRSGDAVTLVSIFKEGEKNGFWLGIQNHTTNRWLGHADTYNPATEIPQKLGFYADYYQLNKGLGVPKHMLGFGLIFPLVTWFSMENFWWGVLIGLGTGVIHLFIANFRAYSDKELKNEFDKILSDFS